MGRLNFKPKNKSDEWLAEFGAKLTSARRRKLLRLWHEQNGRCCYCGIRTHFEGDGAKQGSRRATLEHVTAQSEGGTDTWFNTVMACHRCNTRRPAGMGALEYYRLRSDPALWCAYRVGIRKRQQAAKKRRRLWQAFRMAIVLHLCPTFRQTFEDSLREVEACACS